MNRWHRNYLIRRHLLAPVLRVIAPCLVLLAPLVPKRWYRLDRPLFVVGVSRSGTTLFVEHLGAHPDVCNWSEAAQILDLHFYDRDGDTARTANDATHAEVTRLRLLFGLRTRLQRKRQFVNKHPENSVRMAWLVAAFPDARFLHVIRDGRATVHSHLRVSATDRFRRNWPFGQFPKPPAWRSYLALPKHEQHAHQWVDLLQAVRSDAVGLGLGADRYLEVRYESFCATPATVLAEVDQFLGLDADRRPAVPTSFPNQNDRWRRELSPQQIAEIDAIIGPLNTSLGYGEVD